MSRHTDQYQRKQPDLLSIAIRVYPIPENIEDSEGPHRWWPLPQQMLVFDTETRIDETQRLTFGSYRSLIGGRCVEEGIFYGRGLSAGEFRTLKRYVRTHKPGIVHHGVRELRLLSLSEFLEDLLWLDGYKARGLLVAFNHPFDLSRLAYQFTDARKPFVRIGKESNSIENVESGLEHSERNVYTEYVDPKRNEWATKILPMLKRVPLKWLVRKCRGQLSRRAIIDLRAGRSRPHRRTQKLLKSILNGYPGASKF